jgi:hypothetical protein
LAVAGTIVLTAINLALEIRRLQRMTGASPSARSGTTNA